MMKGKIICGHGSPMKGGRNLVFERRLEQKVGRRCNLDLHHHRMAELAQGAVPVYDMGAVEVHLTYKLGISHINGLCVVRDISLVKLGSSELDLKVDRTDIRKEVKHTSSTEIVIDSGQDCLLYPERFWRRYQSDNSVGSCNSIIFLLKEIICLSGNNPLVRVILSMRQPRKEYCSNDQYTFHHKCIKKKTAVKTVFFMY